MEPNYVIGGIMFVCLIGMSVLFIMVIPTRESILNWLLWKNIEHRESEEQKYLIELAERGEIAPATILSVNATGQHRKNGNNARSRVVYEVDVMPEGQPSFRQTFELWIPVSYSSRARGGGHYGVFDAIEAEMLMHMRVIARERFASILNRPKVGSNTTKIVDKSVENTVIAGQETDEDPFN